MANYLFLSRGRLLSHISEPLVVSNWYFVKLAKLSLSVARRNRCEASFLRANRETFISTTATRGSRSSRRQGWQEGWRDRRRRVKAARRADFARFALNLPAPIYRDKFSRIIQRPGQYAIIRFNEQHNSARSRDKGTI